MKQETEHMRNKKHCIVLDPAITTNLHFPHNLQRLLCKKKKKKGNVEGKNNEDRSQTRWRTRMDLDGNGRLEVRG